MQKLILSYFHSRWQGSGSSIFVVRFNMFYAVLHDGDLKEERCVFILHVVDEIEAGVVVSRRHKQIIPEQLSIMLLGWRVIASKIDELKAFEV